MQKNVGMNFWGGFSLARTEGAEDAEVFHYLAQRAQRARRYSIISHRGRGGRGGILLSRTEGAEDAENPRYLYSRSLLRLNKSFHAGCLYPERRISVHAIR